MADQELRIVKKASYIVALMALAGLAACETPPQEPRIALLDNTGSVVATVRASVVGNTPIGTAVRINLNGQDQTVTVGERQGGASAGQAVVVGNDGGRAIIERITPATGNFAPPGRPVVTGTGSDGRPIITYVQEGQVAPTGTVAGQRGGSRSTAREPGSLAPGVAPVVQPTR